tara:strand:+ start:33409 stop:33660 length:252 start_codon:yes stop_codon:yes gene_type:complete
LPAEAETAQEQTLQAFTIQVEVASMEAQELWLTILTVAITPPMATVIQPIPMNKSLQVIALAQALVTTIPPMAIAMTQLQDTL